MKQLANLSKLDSATFFDKTTLQRLVEVGDQSLYSNIKRWLKNGTIISLKKGLYVTKEFLSAYENKQTYNEFVANILKKPSYLSGEYVLQKYGMMTESIFAFTSVTIKKPRIYNNKLGSFVYSNIKPELFMGFEIVTRNGLEIKEATKVKALFDFLYFRLRLAPKISKEILRDLRLNLSELTNRDIDELQKYVDLSNVNKLNNLTSLLKEVAYVA